MFWFDLIGEKAAESAFLLVYLFIVDEYDMIVDKTVKRDDHQRTLEHHAIGPSYSYADCNISI